LVECRTHKTKIFWSRLIDHQWPGCNGLFRAGQDEARNL
jgi:hypothetical protein